MSRLDKFHVVRSHGEDHEAASKARYQADNFAQVPLDLAADLAKATRSSGAMVWILLIYRAWRTKSSYDHIV